MEHRAFLTAEQQKDLESTIAEAEKKTSGEIRIHVERNCEDPFERGKKVFAQLKMHETKEKNGVLFYLAVVSRRFAILGDEGIHQKVPANFWDQIKEIMGQEFKNGRFVEGLKKGVLAAGEQLATFFPCPVDDQNQLTNTISFGDD